MIPTSIFAFALWLYLLPGLAGFFIYEYIAETTKREIFDKIVMALTLTLSSTLIANFVFGISFVPDIPLDPKANAAVVLNSFLKSNILIVTIISCSIGGLLAYLKNAGIVYNFLRKIKVTRRTGMIDPWHQVFTTFRKEWYIVKYKDGRELVGWPKYYSETGERKELFLADATWHLPVRQPTVADQPQDGDFIEKDVDGEGVFLVNFDNVIAIEIGREGEA